MASQQIPFPGPNGQPRRPCAGAPKLPMMSTAERKLWAASHNLPVGIMLVYESEMRLIQAAAIGAVGQVRKWKGLGKMFLATEIPEQAFEVLRVKLDESASLKQEVARLKAKIAEFIAGEGEGP